MKNYVFGVLSRTCRQFWFFVGRFVFLSILLVVVSSGIRGIGESVLEMRYYYIVMPGVVCHECGHALGCLLTGHEIVEFAPFKPHDDVLGYVVWSPGEISLSTFVDALIIGTGPLWLGCLLVWLLSLPLLKTKLLPDSDPEITQVLPVKGIPYWSKVVKSAFAMLKTMFTNLKLVSLVNVLIGYLLICIVSEMPPSLTDLQSGFLGFLLVIALFFVVNVIAPLGQKIDQGMTKLQPAFFRLHVIMAFVLFIDVMIFAVFFLIG